MGYAGGTTPAPTYESIGDHAEALQISYDPSVISHETLLGMFWAGHDPTALGSSQYRAEPYCAGASDCDAARHSATAIQAELDHPIGTRIVDSAPFFSAEAYHQKWSLRRHRALWSELVAQYASEPEALASVAAAKLNAYVARQGNMAALDRDIDRFGLSESAKAHLRSVALR